MPAGGGTPVALPINAGYFTVDPAGNVYVVNSNGYGISEVPAGTTNTVVTFAKGITGITGMGADLAGNVFVVSGKTTLSRIPAGGGTAVTIEEGAHFTQMQGVALDGNGNIYVGDTGNQTISEADPRLFYQPKPA